MRRTLIATGAAVLLAGCGATKYVTQTQTATTTTTQTTTQTDTRNITHVRRVSSLPPVTTTDTTTTTITTAPRPTSQFSGNGGENLGTIHVHRDSTIHWTNDGGIFSVTDVGDIGVFVNSSGASGTSEVPAGTYTGVNINAVGNWTIQIVPHT